VDVASSRNFVFDATLLAYTTCASYNPRAVNVSLLRRGTMWGTIMGGKCAGVALSSEAGE